MFLSPTFLDCRLYFEGALHLTVLFFFSCYFVLLFLSFFSFCAVLNALRIHLQIINRHVACAAFFFFLLFFLSSFSFFSIYIYVYIYIYIYRCVYTYTCVYEHLPCFFVSNTFLSSFFFFPHFANWQLQCYPPPFLFVCLFSLRVDPLLFVFLKGGKKSLFFYLEHRSGFLFLFFCRVLLAWSRVVVFKKKKKRHRESYSFIKVRISFLDLVVQWTANKNSTFFFYVSLFWFFLPYIFIYTFHARVTLRVLKPRFRCFSPSSV